MQTHFGQIKTVLPPTNWIYWLVDTTR